MQIIAHLGSCDNEYLQEILGFRPTGCPVCQRQRVHKHDDYPRYGSDLTQPIPIYRFRCAHGRCRQVVSVLPSYLVPGQSYPAAVAEAAVVTYASGGAPLAVAAAALGIGTTTVFRWADRACQRVRAWLALAQQALLLLSSAAEVTVRLREDLRRVWRSRRIRKPGKEDQLLLLEQWPPWIRRLRRALANVGGDPAPGWMGALGFSALYANSLSQFISRA